MQPKFRIWNQLLPRLPETLACRLFATTSNLRVAILRFKFDAGRLLHSSKDGKCNQSTLVIGFADQSSRCAGPTGGLGRRARRQNGTTDRLK
jgi:hypothetical protein